MSFNMPFIDVDNTPYLILDGEEYEISEFEVLFGQSTDHKGQPQAEVRGGQMHLTITQTVPDSFYAWAMKTTMKNGSIVFRNKTGSAPLKIEFENAFCLDFRRNMQFGGGLTTTFLISPEGIALNGKLLNNRWTK